MTCPYPPSDPVCQEQAHPTTTTTLQHVIVDNNGFAGAPQISVDAGPDTVEAIQHQTHVIATGFIALALLLIAVGIMITAAIASLKHDGHQDPT